MKVVRLAVDDAKRIAQVQHLQEHAVPSSLPAWQREPRLVGGILHVRDVSRGTPTFGVRSYPEATPIEVVVYVAKLWMKSTGQQHPRTWDLHCRGGLFTTL